MKNLTTIILFVLTLNCFGQVGIGTTIPTATLDINGNLKIRDVPEEIAVNIAKDSVLVVNNGYVKSVPTTNLINETLPTAIKGNFTTTGTVSLSLLSGPETIPFDAEDFDLNDEFDTGTGVYTAKQDGIYVVNVQIKANSAIGIATNFGVQIIKNSTVEARNSFANIGVLGINVTPPVRETGTLLELEAGDTLSFELLGDIALGTVNLLGSNLDSFFTIHQIR